VVLAAAIRCQICGVVQAIVAVKGDGDADGSMCL
jgi:hypothetical protein